ncbi:peptide ABC transporter substrate-binding protein [Bowdeniella nasicola]|uniref:Peptide ABC transporter substrate-binding protein n=1 Tax=Bowdeniella nasicola TaxID=208480 RepID=A0A1Q5Q0G4_9ACTO|nr:peptide ABC transporter substrate-binding protein [Bowdeniella nasicola]OKL53361.1 peptide ABC transporter substrate-binding protein [Bowdeniella nasicola]
MKPLKKARSAIALAASCALMALAACSGGSGSTPKGAATGATGGGNGSDSVSVAMVTPSWIMPISAPGKTQGENGIFRSLMFPTLYDFTLEGTSDYHIKTERSLAEIPQVSDDGLTYTIKLKDLTWSDGKPLTTRDVEFWYNLIKHNKKNWASYREGGFPDNVAEFKVVDDKTVTVTTTEPYAPGYFIGNQLNSIVPMPHHAWAKTSDDGKVDPELDRSEQGAKDIFAYLTKASEDPNSYATNPLWQTVSGPWKLKSFVPSGEVVLEANDAYQGEDKAKLKTLLFKPFTSDDSEFNTLRSGGIDYGYIPAGSIAQKAFIESQGYTVEPWYGWSITYMPFNFNNPQTGPIFKQKYVRQAMQHLIDQQTISKVIWQDMAAPTCGPVPQRPGAAGSLEGCVYDFNPDKAKQLLESHGWEVNPDGVTTCKNPGTGEGQCGEGIDQGKEMRFKVTSQSGFSATTKMFAELKSQFAKLGIVLDIQEVPDSVAVSQACKPDQECTWDLSFFGSQASWYFPVYASGQRLFATDAPVNLGSYSNPQADALIEKTLRSSDESVMKQYNDFLAEDLPVLWMPNPVNRVSAFKSDIKGIHPQEPTLGMYPQDWSR